MGIRISREASKTTLKVVLGLSFCRFSRNRLKMFSTSMMASSTTAPMATANPPSVMALIPTPKILSVRTPMSRLNGMAVSVMKEARTLNRKKTTTMVTTTAPSMRARCRFVMEDSMKFAWRKTWVCISIPEGRVRRMSSRACSTS